ncbi:hypothetical protein BGZ52_005668, partial [Haplosporangium bisporale]
MRMKPGNIDNPPALFKFRFLDTLGFNETKQRDFTHANNFLNEMIKSQRFKLTRILAPHVGALTQEYKEALEHSSDVLRGLHSSIILFHTKVEYLHLHHSSAVFHQNMEVKNDLVGDILQRPLLKPKNGIVAGDNQVSH